MIKIMDKYSLIKLKEQGLSSRKVADMLGINRKTVDSHWHKYLETKAALQDPSNDIPMLQELLVSEPKYNSENRKSRKYTEEMDHALNLILNNEEEKAKLLGVNKQHLSVLQIHSLLVQQGFAIGKTTIANKVREKRNKVKECFIRQEYPLGERLEYDFGEVKLCIDGEVCKCYIAVFSSPALDFRWAYLYRNQKQAVFMDSHVRFFEMMKGVYKTVVYDNMRNVVSKFIGRNQKELNKDLIKLSLYYGFDINVTNAFKGNEKGHVEGSVKIIRNQVFGIKYIFDSFEEAENYLQTELEKLNQEIKIDEEQKYLLPYRPKFELADIISAKVNKYSFVRIEKNDYSVPDYLVGETITAKIYFDKILFYAKNHFVCEHKKVDGTASICADIRHYLRTFQQKPGAIKHSLALKSLPRLKAIYDLYFIGKEKEFLDYIKKYQEYTNHEMEDLIYKAIKTQPSIASKRSSNELKEKTNYQLSLYKHLGIKAVRSESTRTGFTLKASLH